MENKIEVGNWVIVPEPEINDVWLFGNFSGLVVKIEEVDGMVLATVEDADEDRFDVELNRLTLDD